MLVLDGTVSLYGGALEAVDRMYIHLLARYDGIQPSPKVCEKNGTRGGRVGGVRGIIWRLLPIGLSGNEGERSLEG